MRNHPRILLLLFFTLGRGMLQPLAGQTPRPGAIMGWWHGTSTCVKASWNSACSDEVVQYEFIPTSPDSVRSTVSAFKIVAGQPDSMGDLPVLFDRAARMWTADFTTGRGPIRWSFQVHGDTLVGELVHRPAMQVARHVVALRGPSQPSAGAPHN